MSSSFKVPILCLRGAQAVVTIAELGLSAYAAYLATQVVEECYYDSFLDVTQCYDIGGGGVGGLGAFLLFNCSWTLLTILVLTLVPLCSAVHPIAVAVLDGLVMVLWFAGAIALAVYIAGAGPISDAGVALAFIIWALFLASFVLTLLNAIRGAGSRMNNANYNYGGNPGTQQPQQPPAAFNQYQAQPQPPTGAAANYYNQNPELAHV